MIWEVNSFEQYWDDESHAEYKAKIFYRRWNLRKAGGQKSSKKIDGALMVGGPTTSIFDMARPLRPALTQV